MRIRVSRVGRGGHRRQQQPGTPHRSSRLRAGLITAGALALTAIATVVAISSAPPGGDTEPPAEDAPPLTNAQVTAMAEAATSCPTLTAARLAGQVMATTGFEPTAGGGIVGLSADEWEQWKPWDDAVPGDDRASLLALAHLTCDLAGHLRVSGFSGDLWSLAVAAFVSSLDDVRDAAGVPASVADVVDRAQKYAIDYTGRMDSRRTPSAQPSTADARPTATVSASPTPSSRVTATPAAPTSAPRPDRFSIALGPADASVEQGSATTVTVTTAVTSGSAQPVTLSASGLPAGTTASFDPATVTAGGSSTLTLRTSGSTPTGTSTVTVTGRGSATDTASVSLTVTAPDPVCSSPGQQLGNPGFESGTSPWMASQGVITNDSDEIPHSGTRYAWLGGYGEANTTILRQTVSLPAGCTSYTFSFWLHIHTWENPNNAWYDGLTVQVRDSDGDVLETLATYSNLDASGYRKKSFDLAAYAGQTIQLRFTATEDYSRTTSFVIDDVAMDVA